jgi:ubiquinone/menaquinone biosynthesis C-methylase UbiE
LEENEAQINVNYQKHYADREAKQVYPTEFVVRTFLAKYPKLNFASPSVGQKVLDVAFGDGRNTVFLCDRGFEVSGIEITQSIVDQTTARLKSLGYSADLRVGRNNAIPFGDGYFNTILACHCCYYCDEGDSFLDNLTEYARVLAPGGYLVASVADRSSYIFNDAQALPDGSFRIANDPYNNRVGYRLHAFASTEEIEEYAGSIFTDFSFGSASNDYYGVHEKVFWIVCRKR